MNTLEAIKKSGCAEFLSMGFEAASLRRIVKNAGVTTGAFYGYFSTKEALFNAIVEPHAQKITEIYMSGKERFVPEKMGDDPYMKKSMEDVVGYIYDNYNECKIMLCCSAGTRYEYFVHDLVEEEVDCAMKYAERVRQNGKSCDIDSRLCHIIISGMYMGMLETVEHDMPYEQAAAYVKKLEQFYSAGWKSLLESDA